jgi:DNA repair protein RecO (recombination protein O)
MSRRTTRVIETPAFVLHSTPWRETSLILKAFTKEHGIVTMVAKGAKRPYSGLRAALMVFQPLLLSWSGAGEVKTLTQAEVASINPMPGPVLMSGWYMNELLLKLLASEDAHQNLFDAYAQALSHLASLKPSARGREAATVLRRFEWILLREIGYGLSGPEPDFADQSQGPQLKELLQEKILAQVPGSALSSRQVLMSLYRLASPPAPHDL